MELFTLVPDKRLSSMETIYPSVSKLSSFSKMLQSNGVTAQVLAQENVDSKRRLPSPLYKWRLTLIIAFIVLYKLRLTLVSGFYHLVQVEVDITKWLPSPCTSGGWHILSGFRHLVQVEVDFNHGFHHLVQMEVDFSGFHRLVQVEANITKWLPWPCTSGGWHQSVASIALYKWRLTLIMASIILYKWRLTLVASITLYKWRLTLLSGFHTLY